MARKTTRKTKHRGNAAGMIETRGVTGARSQARTTSAQRGGPRGRRPPSWRSAFVRALIAAMLFAVVMLVALDGKPGGVLITTILLLGVYTPAGFYFDRYLYGRTLRAEAAARAAKPRR